MVIYPEVIVTPDTPTIKFHQPRDQVDLSKELPRILHAQGWGCGTYFNVQFLNHEKTKLLACGRFVVTEEVESIQTNDANPYQPMTKTVFSRQAEQIGEWWVPPAILVRAFDEGIGNQTMRPGEIKYIDPPLMEEVTRTVEGTSPEYRAAVAEEPKRRGRPPKAA